MLIESNDLENIIKKCCFIEFFCIQNVSVNNNIQLKRNLKKQGFGYILIKKTAIFKSLYS
jgi:ribosomal protein L10